MKKIIVLCVNNSCRSQMAEGILAHYGKGLLTVVSAGSEPTTVNKSAIRVLSEIGIDISSHRSKSVDEFDLSSFDYVITACQEANDACPYVPPDVRKIALDLRDPAKAVGDDDEVLNEFRKVRDEIKDFAVTFVQGLR